MSGERVFGQHGVDGVHPDDIVRDFARALEREIAALMIVSEFVVEAPAVRSADCQFAAADAPAAGRAFGEIGTSGAAMPAWTAISERQGMRRRMGKRRRRCSSCLFSFNRKTPVSAKPIGMDPMSASASQMNL